MFDYQRIIEDLRNALYAASSGQPQSLPPAAAAYAQACEAINQRLRQCGSLLRQGLRSEAIQQCELEPNLLDLVALLDFPEREQLPEFLQYYQLPQAPNLLLDVAADLNEAYAAQQPLETLLEQHRVLALARSPLSRRIGVLRQIAELDINNPIWREDLALFEAERLNQIQQESHRAAKAGNRRTLESLREEVASPRWQTTPPTNLCQRLDRALEDLWQQESRSRLEELEAHLNDAFAALDVQRGRELREDWEVNAGRCALEPSDPLAQRAAPALEWLAEQDGREQEERDFQSALASLEQGLDGYLGRTEAQSTRDEAAELERRYAAVARFGREMPLHVEQRYRSRTLALADQIRRRFRLMVVAAVSVLLAAGGGVAVLLINMAHDREVAAQTATLQRLLEENSLPEARRYADQLQQQQPAIAASATVQEQILRLSKLEDEEQQRQDGFKQAIQAAVSDGYESPDRQALDRARELATTQAEKAQVATVEAEIADVQRRVQAQRDQTFLAELRPLAEQVAALPNANFTTLDAETAHLRQLESDLQALDARSKRVSPPLRHQLPPLLTRIKNRQQQIARLLEEEHVLEQVALNAHNDTGYRNALESYIEQYPDTARAEEFRKVLAEASRWSEVAAWNQMAGWWNGKIQGELTPTLAVELREKVAAYEKEHPQWPLTALLKQQCQAVACVAARQNAQGESITQPLKATLRVPLHSNCYMVDVNEERGRKRYYLPEAPDLQGETQVRLTVFVDRRGKTAVRAPLSRMIEKHGPAPQAAVANEVLAALDALEKSEDPNRWDAAFCDVLESIAKPRGVDPMLTTMLLKEALAIASRGSDQMKAFLQPHYTILEDSRADPFANWVDPHDTAADSARLQSEIDLKRVATRLLDDIAAYREKLPQYETAPADRYSRLGWLRRNPQGRWQLVSGELSEEASGTLFALEAPEEQPLKWIAIGEANSGKVKLDLEAEEGLIEGRRVWLRRAP